MTQVMEQRGSYLADFKRLEQEGRLPGAKKAWVSELRRRAIETFDATGFPSPSDEGWRFTDITPIVETPFAPAMSGSDEAVPGVTDGPLRSCQLVFSDGFVNLHPSLAYSCPPGIEIQPLSGIVALEAARPALGSLVIPGENPFEALNTAFWSDGAVVRARKGTKATVPVHLLFLSRGGGVAYPRVVVIAEEGSEVSIVESYVGSAPGSRLTNAVTEIVIGRGASVGHYRLQRESRDAFHVGSLRVRQERDSRFVSNVISVGGAIARTDISVLLDGEGAECRLNGLYETTGHQLIDHHTLIDHAKPRCTSRELYKGILDGTARAVFHGRVIVRQDAQKTDAAQANKNLLLSDKALVNTTPQLEILANDVKCKHGATIGQLDRDVLFYLRSRGIGEEAARRLLVHAFASEIADQIPIDAVRAQLGGCLMTMVGEASREYDV